nr:tetratricopeptide repeat protein [uncultured Marinobacter sp.]
MYCRYVLALILAITSGCASIDEDRLLDNSADVLDRTGKVLQGIVSRPDPYEQEQQALFRQPYIDPLTDYLEQYGDDERRATIVDRVRAERNRRCRAVAEEYAEQPATEPVLEQFRAGYQYSCPAEVVAFADRVAGSRASPPMPSPPAPEPETVDSALGQQAVSDCYLLTSIRNFSAARDACLAPAQAGDSQAQANLALIAHAFEDYPEAFQWARKAAGDSGEAAYLLGQMYAAGEGVAPSKQQAVYWYTKAAEQGHEQAIGILKRYGHRVSGSDS